MSGPVTVRPARADEHPAIAAVLLDAFTATFDVTPWYRRHLSEVGEHARENTWWVAVDGDERVLGAVMTPAAAGADEELGFRFLGVAPAARGRGVGRALVEHVRGLAERGGHPGIGIWSGPQMLDAHRLYAACGYERRPELETRVVDGGQRLLSFHLDLRPAGSRGAGERRSRAASPVDFGTYGTVYEPRNVPPASTSREPSAYPFSGRVTPAGGDFPAEPGRYHLYVSLACPFAQRTAIVRALKGLEEAVPIWVVDPLRDGRGWAFRDGPGLTRDGGGGRFELLREAYDATAGQSYAGRVSVPVLWDAHRSRIVSNRYQEIALDLGSAFDAWAERPELDLYPARLRDQIDAIGDAVHRDLSTGVYDAGFATSQEAYAAAAERVFDRLDALEERLTTSPYLVGETLTDADVRLYPTLARFDAVYHGHFKLDRRRIADYPRLTAYLARLARIPAFRQTTDLDHIRRHYYQTQRHLNPTGIVPLGSPPGWLGSPVPNQPDDVTSEPRREHVHH